MHSGKKKKKRGSLDSCICEKQLIILCYWISHLEKFNMVARPKSPLQPQLFQGSLNYSRKR